MHPLLPALAAQLVDDAPMGVGIVDRALRYVRVNAALAAMNERPADEHTGRHIRDVLGAAECDALEPLLLRILETGEGLRDLPLVVEKARRGRRHFLLDYLPARDATGAIAGVLAFARELEPAEDGGLRESALARQLFVLSPLPKWVYDRETLAFLDVNDAAIRRYGWSRDEFLRMTLRDIRPADDLTRLEATVAVPQPLPALRGVFRHVTKHGETLDVQVFSQDLEYGGRPAGIVIVEDVTERQRAERAILAAMRSAESAREESQAAARRLAFLADASARLAGSLDVEATLRTVAGLAVPAMADWCFVEVLEADRVRAAAVAHPDPAMVALAHEVLARYPIDIDADFGTGKVLRTGEPELVPDIPDAVLAAVAQDAEHLEILRRIGFRSSISVPLVEPGGRAVAVLSLVTAESGRRFNPDDLAVAMEIARRASAALASARLYAAGQAALRRATALQQVVSALASTLTAADVGRVVVHHARTTVGADAGSVATFSSEPGIFELAASEGYPDEVVRRFARFPLTPGRPLSDAVTTGRPVYLESPAVMDARYPYAAATMGPSGFEAMAVLPLVMGGAPRGAITLGFRTARHFDAEDRTFLETIASQAGQALERAALIEAERTARDEAQAANAAKSQFLATMSHELRTPLNAIGGYVQLLELGIHGPLSDAQRETLDRVQRSTRHLLGLINEVLNYTRLEMGAVTYDLQPTRVADAVREAVSLVEPLRTAKGIALGVRAGDDDAHVVADREKLQQILLNLLSNAVKFTEAGGRIDVRWRIDADAVAIEVADTGIGIPPERHADIFEPFVQVRTGLARSAEGTGLGLAISRDLARGMGGELTVASTPGEGSTFALRAVRA